MTEITQPSQGRRAESTGSAFIKPPLRRGVAVVGTSSLVLGMVIGGGSLAAANNLLCSEQILRPMNNPQGGEQADAIQAAMADGLVCLDGDFVLQSGIFFQDQDPVKIIGLNRASITKVTGNADAVFHNMNYSNASIEIENVDISNPQGRIVNGYAVTIRDSTFSGRTGGSDGGAINARNVVISNSILSNFSVENEGGAIFARGNVTVSDSELSGNASTGEGGAIWATGSVVVSTSTLSNNDSGLGGGAIFAIGSVTISNSKLSENEADGEGGAIRGLGTVNVSASVLSSNKALGSVGGAVSGAGAVTASNSTLSGNTSATGGGAIYANGGGNVTILNSTLTENTSNTEGGAIFTNASSTISDSTLTGNTAVTYGGGIWGYGTISITSSTFYNNVAERGGAIFGHRDLGVGGTVNVSNSTFVENKALGTGLGGAINAQIGEAYFNTFVNNQASAPVDGRAPGNAIYKPGNSQITLGANIFGGNSPHPQLGRPLNSTGHFIDNGGNIFSTSSSSETGRILGISESTRFESSLSVLFGTSSPVLATYAPNSSNTQTIGLAAGSPALGIVPNAAPFTSDTYRLDQRGATRIDPRDAGAFQGVAPVGGGSSADFTVFSLPTGITKPGSEVKVTGANLNLVKEVYVNGVKVKIKKQGAASLVFNAPRGLTGVVDVRFVSAASQYNAFRGLDFGSSAASGTKARTVVGGFAANSTRLSMKMKREIRAFLKTNSGLSSVTCMGFTSEPATALDAALAKARGQVTCNYIKKLDPDLKVKVVQGRHTELPGSKIRRVRITIE